LGLELGRNGLLDLELVVVTKQQLGLVQLVLEQLLLLVS